MARRDDIFGSFLEHPVLKEKYEIEPQELSISLAQGLQSDIPIIKSIAIIVDALEGKPISESALRNKITQYLNSAAI